MAKYLPAQKKTGGNEGGFANVPGDNGGVTYCGITYKNYHDWPYWPQVFAAKLKNGDILPELAQPVLDFYKKEFWDKVHGDEIQDQEIAEQLYDMAVNAGIAAAARIAQETCGVEQTGKFSTDLISRLNGTA